MKKTAFAINEEGVEQAVYRASYSGNRIIIEAVK